MTKKREFRVRCLSPDIGIENKTVKVPAASWPQALLNAKLQNPRHTDFGLLNQDDQIHRWHYRYGEPKARVSHGNTAIRDAMERAQPSAQTETLPQPVAVEPAGPKIVSVNAIAGILIQSALPQMQFDVRFMARDLVALAPEKFRAGMKGQALSHAMDHLVSSGAVTRAGRVRYLRVRLEAPEVVEAPSPTVSAALPAPAINGNGSHSNGAAILANPPAPSQPAPSLPTPFSAAEKIEALLLVSRAVLSDTRERQARFKAIADRLVDCAAAVDKIREDLEEFVRKENEVPAFVEGIMKTLRGGSISAPAIQ